MTTTLTQPNIVLPLWNGPAPQSQGTEDRDIPSIIVFLPESVTEPTAAVVICPGGGYAGLAMDHEGYNEARYLQAKGVAGIILKYRLPAAVPAYRHPVPLRDVQRAFRYIRENATKWNIDSGKIGVMGFSAGGHLAATIDTHYDAGNPKPSDPIDRQGCRPDFAVLVYGVISMQDGVTHDGSKQNLLGPDPDPALVENLSNELQVTSDTPPTILVHSIDDFAVVVENSRLMHAALVKAGVPTRLDEYPTGGHGFGFGATPDNSPEGWLDRVYDWLKAQKFFP